MYISNVDVFRMSLNKPINTLAALAGTPTCCGFAIFAASIRPLSGRYVAKESMSNIRVVFIITGAIFLVLTHIGDTYYRDWVYTNQIADFGLANYLPSITGTITAIFLLIGLSKESFKKAPSSAFRVMVGCVIYEFMQPILGTGVFDWQDFFAVVITGCIVVLVLNKSNKTMVNTAT